MTTRQVETEKAPRKGGRPRKPRITIREIASLDPPEIRLFRAKAAGFEIIETPVPGTTRETFRKIETPFDYAKRRGWISPHQHRAAEILSSTFQKAGLLPRVTMAWTSFVDGSGWSDGSEIRDRHAKQFRCAVEAIPQDYRDSFLTWFLEAQSDDTSVDNLGALFTPLKHKEARKAAGILVLTKVLNHLSWHYSLMHEKSSYELLT